MYIAVYIYFYNIIRVLYLSIWCNIGITRPAKLQPAAGLEAPKRSRFATSSDLRRVPVVLMNARLVQDTQAVAGIMLRNYRNFEQRLGEEL